jgi:hypothetical protein
MDTTIIQTLPDAPSAGSIAEKSLITALQIFAAGDQKTALDIINFAPVSEATKGALIAHLQKPQEEIQPVQPIPMESFAVAQEIPVPEQVIPEPVAEIVEPVIQEEINSETFTIPTPEPETEPVIEQQVIPESEPIIIPEPVEEVPAGVQEIPAEQPVSEAVPTIEQPEETLDLPAFDIPTGEPMTFDQILSEQKDEAIEQPLAITTPQEVITPAEVPQAEPVKQETPAVNPLLQMLMAQRAKEEHKEEVVASKPMTTELEVAPIEIAPVAPETEEGKPADDLHAMLDSVTANETAKSSRESSFAELFARVSESEKNAFTGEITAPIPGIIHTYDTTSEDEAAAKHATLIEQQAANKSKNLFQRVDDYLKKAYTSGDSHLIASAERQLQNLMNQYPEYAEVFPDHAQKLQSYKNQLIEKKIDEALIGGIAVKPGMKISSEAHQYIVTEIHQGISELEIIFENETGARYAVGETPLAGALTADAINPDEFFAPFVLQNK